MRAMGRPHPPLRGTLSRSRERVGCPHPPLRGTLSRSRERDGVRVVRNAKVLQ